MSGAHLTRRQFLATSSALVAAVTAVPAWADTFEQGPADDALRAEVADVALSRAAALGASYADIRVNRYRRESIATRERQVQNVSRSTSRGLGLRVLVDGAWGFAATNRVEPVGRPHRRRAGGGDRARQRGAHLAQGRARQRRQGDDHVDERVQARSVRRAARHQDRVPDEAERDRTRRSPASRSSARRCSSSTSRSTSPRARARASRSGWSAPIRSSRPLPPTARAATSRRASVVDRAQLVGYEYVEDYPWLPDAEKAGHEVVEKLKAKPVAPGRYDIVVDPSQLFLAIHESVGHSTELDRSLGWEANMAGTSFLKAGGRRQAALRREHRQPGRRSHPARRPGDHRLRR